MTEKVDHEINKYISVFRIACNVLRLTTKQYVTKV